MASVAEASGIENVNKDTVINDILYFKINNSELKRVDENRLYAFENGIENVELEFTTLVGDTIIFLGHWVVVENISDSAFFGEIQKTYKVSSKSIYTNSIITGIYATKFGIIKFHSQQQSLNGGYSGNTKSLFGAKLSNQIYGVLPY